MKVDRSAGLTLWGCLLLSQFSSAESYWGLGGGAGYWSADARDLRTELESALRDPGLAPAKGSVEKGRWNWEAEAFYERSLRDSWRLDFGGLRLKAGLRYYFGGASPRTGHTQPYLWPG